jgi:hypothetical protein
MHVLTKSQGDPDVTCKRLLSPSRNPSPLTSLPVALVPIGVWSVVETNIGVLLTCLPSMLPILRLLLGKTAKASNAAQSPPPSNGSRARKLRPSTWRTNMSDQSFSRLKESQTEAEGYGQMVAAYRTTSDEEGKASAVTQPQGIHVKQDIEWT